MKECPCICTFVIINQEEGGSSPSSHSRAVVALGRQKAALEERVVKLQKQKAHLEAAVEQGSLQLQQVCVARERVDKVLKDMASLETEENQGYVQFWCIYVTYVCAEDKWL